MAAATAVMADVLQIRGRELQCILYKNVENAADIRAALVSDSKRRDMALINAAMVAGTFHLQLGAFKALEAEASGKLATKSLHTELVYSLAGHKYVGESLKRCGIHDDTQHVLVALFDATPEDVEGVVKLVRGTHIPLSQLSEVQQAELIQQVFKVTKEELGVGSLEDAVVAKLAAMSAETA